MFRAILRRKLLSGLKDSSENSGMLQAFGKADGERPAGTVQGWLNPACEVARGTKKAMVVGHVQKYYIGMVRLPWLGWAAMPRYAEP